MSRSQTGSVPVEAEGLWPGLPLSALVLQPLSGQVKSIVVFVHGYGADGRDLIGLGAEWAEAFPDTLFVSPNAPHRCDMSPMGYQWFPITRLSPTEMATGVLTAAPVLDAFLDGLIDQTGVEARHVYLLGFSQGTMMSLHVGLRRKEALGGIVGYSGMLVQAEALRHELTHAIPVLLVHGSEDEVVPAFCLQQAVEGLEAAGLTPDHHLIPGLMHGIDPTGLRLGCAHLQAAMAQQDNRG